MQPCKEKCGLALEHSVAESCHEQIGLLLDDEELELRELEAGSNPSTCCDHISSNGMRGCSLCGGWYNGIHQVLTFQSIVSSMGYLVF